MKRLPAAVHCTILYIRQETVTCPNCQTPNPSSAKFCINCGNKMVSEEHCPECGGTIVKGAKFCPNCGKKLIAVCPNCGKELVSGAKFCLECGTQV